MTLPTSLVQVFQSLLWDFCPSYTQWFTIPWILYVFFFPSGPCNIVVLMSIWISFSSLGPFLALQLSNFFSSGWSIIFLVMLQDSAYMSVLLGSLPWPQTRGVVYFQSTSCISPYMVGRKNRKASLCLMKLEIIRKYGAFKLNFKGWKEGLWAEIAEMWWEWKSL